jgi:hypothetical protein
MGRVRVSTTVDEALLSRVREIRAGANDATIIDESLEALLRIHRTAEFDAAYAAYEEHPLDEPDAWGDLASFRDAAGDS